MRIRTGMLVLMAGFLSTNANALTCTDAPDCSALGYTKTSAECPDGGIKCPFNPNLMYCLRKGGGTGFSVKNKVNNLDIVYSDGTTSATLNASKKAIGVAIVTETNASLNHGIIFSYEQPASATWEGAIKGCANYLTNGTAEGDWQLPTLYDMMEINGWDTDAGGRATSQYTNLKNKMKLIPGNDQFGFSAKYGYTESGSPNQGGTYLQGKGPVTIAGTNVCGCSASASSSASCRFYARETRYDGQAPSYCTDNTYDTSYDLDRLFYGTKSGIFSGSCNGATTSVCPPSPHIESEYYWTSSEMVATPTNTYYAEFGNTGINRVMSTAKGSIKSLYRCVIRF